MAASGKGQGLDSDPSKGENKAETSGKSHIKEPNNSLNSSKGLKTMALNGTKAGMDGLDLEKINQIIQKSSEGSKFYNHKKKAQEKLDSKIAEIKRLINSFSNDQVQKAEKTMDETAKELEMCRDLSRVIVHIDMDMFFAAVEMRDDPSLKDKPMAVGGMSMLSTSNYIARKFGVRAAMPGFIAKKLCPQLIIVKSNYQKYTEVSEKVQEILKDYDDNFSSMSLDEAYLDITDYLAEKNTFESESSQITPIEVVKEIRDRIFETTQLTASAGIAPNGLLAKICGDLCKPNNQALIEPKINAVKDFILPLPIRKVNGIGNVTEQLLKGIGINNCGEIWEKRGLVSLVFKPATVNFLLAVSMGIGNSFFAKESVADDRKSYSCERTFKNLSQEELKELCKKCSFDLEKDLKSNNALAKSVCLKIKNVNFEVKTRVKSMPSFTHDGEMIFNAAWSIYERYLKEEPNLSLRLLGVRVSSLKFKEPNEGNEQKQKKIDELFVKNQPKRKDETFIPEIITLEDSSMDCMPGPSSRITQKFECPLCATKFFSVRDVESHLDECLSQPDNPPVADNEESREGIVEENGAIEEDNDKILCPICSLEIKSNSSSDLDFVNKHIDECLNKGTIKELIRERKNDESLKKTSDKKAECGQVNIKKRPSTNDDDFQASKRTKSIESYFKK